MKKLYLLLCFFSLVYTQAQTNYANTQVSVLTIGPGSSLNDAFGHNGIRIKTPTSDVVYDYGRFPFDDPNFYLNFARGKLLYSQGFSNTLPVIEYYRSQNRTIKEQVLNLTEEEKRDIHAFLKTNALPQNREYLYDFFYDNCATKIRDVLEQTTHHNVQFHTPEALGENTFRELIRQNVHWNSWGGLGIDLALGSIIDQRATDYEHMFLPEYIHQFFENASRDDNNQNLVTKSEVIYTKVETEKDQNFFLSPLFIIGVLSLIILYITFKNYKTGNRSKWLDFSLFLFTGLTGVFLLLLWFATDHTTTANNYNLLWAFALNILVAHQVLKTKVATWFKKYLSFLIILLALLVFHWFTGVQSFAYALIPLLIAIAVRYVYLFNYFSRK